MKKKARNQFIKSFHFKILYYESVSKLAEVKLSKIEIMHFLFRVRIIMKN